MLNKKVIETQNTIPVNGPQISALGLTALLRWPIISAARLSSTCVRNFVSDFDYLTTGPQFWVAFNTIFLLSFANVSKWMVSVHAKRILLYVRCLGNEKTLTQVNIVYIEEVLDGCLYEILSKAFNLALSFIYCQYFSCYVTLKIFLHFHLPLINVRSNNLFLELFNFTAVSGTEFE